MAFCKNIILTIPSKIENVIVNQTNLSETLSVLFCRLFVDLNILCKKISDKNQLVQIIMKMFIAYFCIVANICIYACYCLYILISKVTNSPENPQDLGDFFYLLRSSGHIFRRCSVSCVQATAG